MPASRDAASAHRDTARPANEGMQFAGRHGLAVPRGHTLLPGTRGGRFGRMFGALPPCDLSPEATTALYSFIEFRSHNSSEGADNLRIPAGYTYLGQFVDHDITFDPTSVLERDNDPHALVNFRTPRYDLDSVYGSGPQDQPFLYDRKFEQPGVKLLVGHNPQVPGRAAHDQPFAEIDLPRNEQEHALVGDARNDENLIVSQLHLLFIHFHNEVVDRLCGDGQPRLEGPALFEEARRIVRWHYQWIVVHDFLERLVGKPMAHSVLRPGARGEAPTITRRFFTWQDEPAMPVEFSAAAFRCGHSMVRVDYGPKLTHGTSFPIFEGTDGGEHFGGFRRLPTALVIDWERFFRMAPGEINSSKFIDERIAPALFKLPPDGTTALPLRNLQRAIKVGLPSGQDVANAMGVDRLDAAQLMFDHDLVKAHAPELMRATPLWYYILREAKTLGIGVPAEAATETQMEIDAGMTLGPIGGRIVAEVLVGLLEGDPQSYLSRWPAWTPEQEAETLRLEQPVRRPQRGANSRGRTRKLIRSITTMPDIVQFVRGEL